MRTMKQIIIASIITILAIPAFAGSTLAEGNPEGVVIMDPATEGDLNWTTIEQGQILIVDYGFGAQSFIGDGEIKAVMVGNTSDQGFNPLISQSTIIQADQALRVAVPGYGEYAFVGDGEIVEYLLELSGPVENCITAMRSDHGENLDVQGIENTIVTIDTRDGSSVYLRNWDIVDGVEVDKMDLVVQPGEYITSTQVLSGIVWTYPPECSFGQVIEFTDRDREYRASYDVPLGTFFVDWESTGVFEKVSS